MWTPSVSFTIHACLSQTSRLPVYFVFGRQPIDARHCSQEILSFAFTQKQPLLVLFALNYSLTKHEQRFYESERAPLRIKFLGYEGERISRELLQLILCFRMVGMKRYRRRGFVLLHEFIQNSVWAGDSRKHFTGMRWPTMEFRKSSSFNAQSQPWVYHLEVLVSEICCKDCSWI